MIDIKTIVPNKDLVVVKLTNIISTYENLLDVNHSSETDIAARYGEVISIGPEATLPEHCLGLKVKDIAIFTEYAGYYIPSTDTDSLYKVIRGHDIIGKHMKESDISDKDSAIPTGDRVLVEIIDIANQQDNIIINTQDPKLADLSYGKILKINESINKLKLTVGQQVAFAPYVGTFIRNYESDKKKALKIIVEEDILFTF